MIQVKRVYEEATGQDGRRYHVDRLWPRGVKNEALKLDGWFKEVAPSTQLRQWFGHDPGKWADFKKRYIAELNEDPAAWQPLVEAAREGPVTLLYSARDTEHNDALVLKDYLETRLKRRN